MGLAILSQRVARNGNLSHATRSLLLALASYADGDGRCWPSVDTLAQDSGASRRQVFHSVAELEQAGVIECERKPGLSTVYRILLEPVQPLHQCKHCTRAVISPEGCNHCTGGVQPLHPKDANKDTIEGCIVAEPATSPVTQQTQESDSIQLELSPPKEHKPKAPPAGLVVVQLWNQLLPANGVARMDKRNVRTLNRYAQEHEVEWWTDLFTCAQRHPYWSGRGRWGAVPFARILSVEGFDKFCKDIDAMLASEDNQHRNNNDLGQLSYG